LARKKEMTTSHTTVLFDAANMPWKSRVCVRRPTDAPSRAQAPLGKGDRTKPQITATNRDSRDHACDRQQQGACWVFAADNATDGGLAWYLQAGWT
jgi:hypothetical protein